MSGQHGQRAALGISAFLAGAAGLAWVQTAHAADIPGSSKTKATLKVESANRAYTQGVFERANDSDWYRVSLTKGKHYYIAVNGGFGEYAITAIVRNSSGKELKRGIADPYIDAGYEFLAPYTGTYYVDYRVPGSFSDPSLPYDARVSTDCAGGLKTSCTQAVGQTRKSLLGGGFGYDVDWFKTSLSVSKTYTVSAAVLDGCGDGFSLGINDRNGQTVAYKRIGEGSGAITAFRPASNGTYFLAVNSGDDCTLLYSLSLKTP